jgi:hypothetical protein
MSKAKVVYNEKGNALVLSVLILLSLTSIGIISVQRTNAELQVSGNVTRTAQAHSASEAGMMHSIGLVGGAPQHYADLIEQRRVSALKGIVAVSVSATYCDSFDPSLRQSLSVVCKSSAILDDGNQDHFLQVVDGDVAINRIRQEIAYQAEIIPIGIERGMLGTAVDTDICQQYFDFSARGGIPSAQESVEETLCLGLDNCVRDTIVVENRSRAIVGPIQCPDGE